MLMKSLGRARDFVGFMRDPLSAFVDTARRRGDVAVLPIPGARLIQLTHPDHVAAFFKMTHRDRLGTESLKDLLGNGLITNNGDDHRARRQIVGRPLSRKALATFVDDMRQVSQDWAVGLDAGHVARSMPITGGLFRLSLDILIRTLFGARIELDRVAFTAQLDTYMYEFYMDNTRWRRMVPPTIVTPGRQRRQQAVQAMRGTVRRCITSRRALGPGNDLLWVLMDAHAEEGGLLSEDDLLDEFLTMLIPGHETPALMLGYAIWLLASHPAMQQRLYEEVVARGATTMEELAACPFLGAVVDESFRIYPPAYVIGREVCEPMEFGHVRAEPGNQLIVPQWVVHRDERWWKDPKRFRPDRWLNGETAELAPGTFFPFGGGQRNCLGGHFSRLMGQIVLAEVVRHLEFETDRSYALEFIQGPTLRPRDEIRVRVRRRTERQNVSPSRKRFEMEAHSV